MAINTNLSFRATRDCPLAGDPVESRNLLFRGATKAGSSTVLFPLLRSGKNFARNDNRVI